MALRKGFLRTPYQSMPPGLWLAVLTGLFYGFGIYGFFYVIREGLQFAFSRDVMQIPVIVEGTARFCYNLSLAFSAVTIGFMFSLKPWFRQWQFSRYQHFRRKLRSVDQSFTAQAWIYLYVMGKAMLLIGISYLSFRIDYHIIALEDFKWILILFPLVLFLSIWPPVQRIAGQRAWKWMAYGFVLVLGSSLVLSQIELYDYQQINEKRKAGSIWLSHDLEVPATAHQGKHKPYGPPRDRKLFVVTGQSSPIYFWEDTERPLTLEELQESIRQTATGDSPHHSGSRLIRLYADKSIPYGTIQQLVDTLQRAGYSKIHFQTAKAGPDTLPPHYPGMQNHGYRWMLRQPDSVSLAFLQELNGKDLSKHQLYIPEGHHFNQPWVSKRNRVKVSVDEDSFYINGAEVSPERLGQQIDFLIRKFPQGFVVIYAPEASASYGQYIRGWDLLAHAYDQILDEAALLQFGKKYNKLAEREQWQINAQYQFAHIQWDAYERELNRYIQSSARIRYQ